MKKRLVQSLILGGFLLVITNAASGESVKNEKQIEEVYKRYAASNYFRETTVAGVFDNIPKLVDSPNTSVNEVVVVAEEEPEIPEIETSELYLSYVRMEFSREKFYEDLDLLAAITMAEAGNQSELGKRLVIDTVLNRCDSDCWRDDDTIEEVITHPGQYDTYNNGAYTRVSVTEDIPVLVEEEIISRTNSQVFYFKTNGYFVGVPSVVKEGAHYFSGENKR